MTKRKMPPPPELAPRPYIVTNESGETVLIASRGIESGHIEFPPKNICNDDLTENIEDFILPRAGTLYSYTVTTLSPLRQEGPLVLGYVDLLPDVRVFAQIEIDPADARCDLPVKLIATDPIKAPNGAEVLKFKFASAE